MSNMIELQNFRAPIDQLRIIPDSYQYADTPVWGPWPQYTFAVFNWSSDPVHIYAVYIDGPDFMSFIITQNPADQDIYPGIPLPLSVVFEPTSPFAKTADIVVVSDLPDARATLTGNGIGPVISVSTFYMNFNSVPVGSTATQELYITNFGNSDLNIYDMSVGTDQFRLPGPTFGTIAPNNIMTVPVQFIPTSTGSKTDALSILSDDPVNWLVQVGLAGSGETYPVMQIVPNAKDFGNVPVNSMSLPQLFTISNVNTLPLILENISLGGTNPEEFTLYDVPEPGTVLNHGESVTFSATFSPAASGTRQAQIIIPSNDIHSPALVGVSGQGTAAVLTVLPSGKDFRSIPVGSSSVPQTFTIQNTGNSSLVLGAIQVQGSDSVSFIMTNDSCSGQTFAPGGSGTFGVFFKPLSAGAKSAQVSIPSNASEQPVILDISGIGVSPAISVTPGSCSFGNVLVGTISGLQTITVTNTGTANLLVGSIAIQGVNAGEFSIQNDNCTGQTIIPELSATFQLAFAPASVGAKAASALIQSNAANSPVVTIPLTGTGQTYPSIVAAPTFGNFGDVPAGTPSAAQTFTISNGNSLPLVIGTITVGGANPGDFLLRNDGCSGRTLAHGESATFDVVFSPMSASEKQAAVQVPSNDPDVPVLVIPVNGRGTIAAISVQPESKNFRDILFGSSSLPQTFTVQNTGMANLVIGSLSLGGANTADFTIISDQCSGGVFGPGLFGTFSVYFRPTSGGSKSAQVNIPSDSAGVPVFSVPLTGNCIIQNLTSEPAAKVYPPTTPGSVSRFETFTVTNRAKYAIRTGRAFLTTVPVQAAPAAAARANPALGAAAKLTLLRYDDPDAPGDAGDQSTVLRAGDTDQFIIRNDHVSDRTFLPNESATLEAAFVPTRPGTFRANINVPTDDPALPLFKIQLVGTAPVGPRVAASPFTFDFGRHAPGTASAPVLFTVSSIGSSNLYVTDVVITGRNFRMFRKVNDNCSGNALPQGTSATFGVVFAPCSEGCKEATAQIYSNDLQLPINTVWLYGRG